MESIRVALNQLDLELLINLIEALPSKSKNEISTSIKLQKAAFNLELKILQGGNHEQQ